MLAAALVPAALARPVMNEAAGPGSYEACSTPTLTGPTQARVGENYTVTGSGFAPGSIVPLEITEAGGCCLALQHVADAAEASRTPATSAEQARIACAPSSSARATDAGASRRPGRSRRRRALRSNVHQTGRRPRIRGLLRLLVSGSVFSVPPVYGSTNVIVQVRADWFVLTLFVVSVFELVADPTPLPFAVHAADRGRPRGVRSRPGGPPAALNLTVTSWTAACSRSPCRRSSHRRSPPRTRSPPDPA